MANDDWKLIGVAVLAGLFGYGISKMLEGQGHKEIWIQVRSIEGRVGVVEGRVLGQGETIAQTQLDIRMLQTQDSNVVQRVSRVETVLAQPLPPPGSDPDFDGWRSTN